MKKVTLSNGDELLIVPESEAVKDMGLDFSHKVIGTLTVHDDRSVSVDFEPKAEWAILLDDKCYFNPGFRELFEQKKQEVFEHFLQSQLPLVNPVDISGQTFSNEHRNRWQEAESKLMKPGKYLVIIKTK